MQHPTILRLPEWFGEPEQILLPLPAAEYQVQEVHHDWWHVVAKRTGQTVYTGLGPINLEHRAGDYAKEQNGHLI